MTGFALAAVLAAATPVSPSPAVLPGPAKSEAEMKVSRVTAAALARTVAQANFRIPIELDQARKAFLASPTVDADAKQLESEYPGIWAAVWTTIEPDFRRSLEANYRKLWFDLEELYTSRLTEAEGVAILEFYRSPGGQKLLRSVADNFDFAPILGTMTADQVSVAIASAKFKAAEQIGAEHRPELVRLLMTVSREKFRSVAAETKELTDVWASKQDPEEDARFEALMQMAMEHYMASHPRKK